MSGLPRGDEVIGNKVLLSVEPSFSLNGDDFDLDLWIVGSLANQSLSVKLRSSERLRSVTVFNDSGNAEGDVLSMLPTVFEHHPRATIVVVRGLSPDEGRRVSQRIPPEWVGSLKEGESALHLIK